MDFVCWLDEICWVLLLDSSLFPILSFSDLVHVVSAQWLLPPEKEEMRESKLSIYIHHAIALPTYSSLWFEFDNVYFVTLDKS
jgi:hypothetical protein